MNFVFITLDTQRGDRLGCYGYWRQDISPNIDRIATEGVRFTDYWASGMPTGPGYSCLHSGMNCISHRFYLTPWDRPNRINFDDSIEVAAGYFVNNGYTTAAVDNLINFGTPMKQFVRGYSYYMNPTRKSSGGHAATLADQANAMALPWLRTFAKDAQPFFLWIHYWDPHTPYNHPPEWRGHYKHTFGSPEGLHTVPAKAGYDYIPGWGAADRFQEHQNDKPESTELGHDLYDEEVRYVDHAVGQVYETLDELGVLDDTCLVITSDHGEELGQHRDYWGHKYLYQPNCYLPLIIRCPQALPQGVSVEGIAEQVDVLPTMLDLAGLLDPDADPAGEASKGARLRHPVSQAESMKRFDGRSLLPQVRGEAPGRDVAFTEGGNNWYYYRAIMKDGWRYIRPYYEGDIEELFNFDDDPAELYNLTESHPDKHAEMSALMDQLVAAKLAGSKDPIPRTGAWNYYPLEYFMQVAMGHGDKRMVYDQYSEVNIAESRKYKAQRIART